jgi:hypothetical protein
MSFWESLLQNLASNLASTILIGGCLTYLWKWYRAPRVKVIVNISHGAPSSKKKGIEFLIKNEGKISLMPQEAQCSFFADFEAFKITGSTKKLISADKGAYFLYECFNENPCHPGATISLLNIETELVDDFKYDWVDEIPFYASIFTNNGVGKPATKSIVINGEIKTHDNMKAYRVSEVVI